LREKKKKSFLQFLSFFHRCRRCIICVRSADTKNAIETDCMNQNIIKLSVVAIVLTFSVALFGGASLYARCAPVSHVVIDADTAVELALDRENRVIVNRVYHAADATAQTMLSLAGKPLPQAVAEIVRAAHQTGGFDPDAAVGIFVCAHGPTLPQSRTMTDALTAQVQDVLQELGVSCSVCGMACSGEFLAAGHNKDVSPARLCMISALDYGYNDPPEMLYKRMLKYDGRQLKRKYAAALEKSANQTDSQTFLLETTPKNIKISSIGGRECVKENRQGSPSRLKS